MFGLSIRNFSVFFIVICIYILFFFSCRPKLALDVDDAGISLVACIFSPGASINIHQQQLNIDQVDWMMINHISPQGSFGALALLQPNLV